MNSWICSEESALRIHVDNSIWPMQGGILPLTETDAVVGAQRPPVQVFSSVVMCSHHSLYLCVCECFVTGRGKTRFHQLFNCLSGVQFLMCKEIFSLCNIFRLVQLTENDAVAGCHVKMLGEWSDDIADAYFV